jgi:hypothetical protein
MAADRLRGLEELIGGRYWRRKPGDASCSEHQVSASRNELARAHAELDVLRVRAL